MCYDELIAKMQKHGENCILLEDFDGHVGSSIDGYEGVQGDFGREKGTEKDRVYRSLRTVVAWL